MCRFIVPDILILIVRLPHGLLGYLDDAVTDLLMLGSTYYYVG